MLFRKSGLPVQKTIELEDRLATSRLAQLGYAKTDEDLARDLKLQIKEVSTELPSDTEAALVPSDDQQYWGTIKVKTEYRKTMFACIHEIIHYVFDVGCDTPVCSVFERKIKGKTPDEHEQEINYLAASYSMPYKQIAAAISQYNQSSPKMDELRFVSDLCQKYGQKRVTVLRRIREVKRIARQRNESLS